MSSSSTSTSMFQIVSEDGVLWLPMTIDGMLDGLDKLYDIYARTGQELTMDHYDEKGVLLSSHTYEEMQNKIDDLSS